MFTIYYRKLRKYTDAATSHAGKLLRLLPGLLTSRFFTQLSQHEALALVSHAYFGDGRHLAAMPPYQGLAQLNLPAPALCLNFVPLPPRWERRLFGRSLLDIHHAARVALVRECLPAHRRILDLGGADSQQKCGALLAMGYPHTPERVHIVDLPPQQRRYDPSSLDAIASFRHGRSLVTYSYHSMCQLPDGEFDMIWMGQTIEHIHPTQFDDILRQAAQRLPVGGRFCLDTPNRLLTRLLDAKNLIHPDHKHEYVVSELLARFQRYGLRLERSLALNPLPLSRRSGYLHRIEFLQSPHTGENADDGFSFYLQFIKDA